MGKPKSRSKGWTYSQREPKSSSPSLMNGATTAETMLEKISNYMESCDFALAEKFANRALERFPDHDVILEVAAQCYTEVGHIQKARACYQKAIAKNPLKGWRKYLGYAQLLEGKDAVLQYTRGVEVMERQIAEKADRTGKQKSEFVSGACTSQPEGNSPDAASTSDIDARAESTDDEASFRDLSSAYLAIYELYTTDLCDEENAEDMCKYALERAMLADPKNPEAFQQMANFYLIKDDKELAKQYVKGGLSLWYKSEKDRQPTSSSSNPKGDSAENSELPSLAFQVETAKALIECGEFDLAEQLTSDFIGQSPADPELWYLRGLTNYLHGQSFYRQARSDFKKAIEYSTTPHGVCYDIINQCKEHLTVIAEILPMNEADSDDEDEPASAQGAAPAVEDNSDWETDEEKEKEEKNEDVVMD